jgi:hypothetical protein
MHINPKGIIKMNTCLKFIVVVLASSLILNGFNVPSAKAWDSKGGNPTHPTHSYLTEWAIDQLKGQSPEGEY